MTTLSIIFLQFEEKSAIACYLRLPGLCKCEPIAHAVVHICRRNTAVEKVQVPATLNKSITVIWDVISVLIDPDSRGSGFLRKVSTCVPK